MMKKLGFLILFFAVIFTVLGCNEGGRPVKNPPAFVEMHVGDEGDFIGLGDEVQTGPRIILLDETSGPVTAEPTTTTIPIDVEYEASVFSHADFEIVVITSGANYDLLYSVELVDSILGTCVYTDQSLLYKANATIITETDGSYRTEITLTIPGSTEHDEYLSERTISLNKILFTRDTASGTFPADIPNNTETTLVFEVHARKYLDATVGLPLFVNNGKVDVIAMPSGDYFADAEALAKTAIVIPATINGYQVGKVVLWDIDWVETIAINGASENVLLLGDFASMTTLSISNLTRLETEADADLIFDGAFTSLAELSFTDSTDFKISMVNLDNWATGLDETYDLYRQSHSTDLSEFPALVSLSLANTHSQQLRLGSPTYDMIFPVLTSISLTESIVSWLSIGSERNQFPLLTSVSLSDSVTDSFLVSGTMGATSTPATIEIINSHVTYVVRISGSIVGEITVTNSEIKDLEINGGTIQASKVSGLTISESVIDSTGKIEIKGNHPLLTEIDFSDLVCGNIILGSVENGFAALTRISLTNIDGGYIYIGDRDTDFPVLTEIVVDHVVLSGNLRIGYENSSYPELVEILITDLEAEGIIIGRGGDDFSGLQLLYFEDVALEESFTITGGTSYTSLEAIVIRRLETSSFGIQAYGGAYDVYIDELQTTNNPYIADACDTVYVNLPDVTTWAYYSYVSDLGHTITSGAYNPT